MEVNNVAGKTISFIRENLLQYIISNFDMLGPNIIFHLFSLNWCLLSLLSFCLSYSKFHIYNFLSLSFHYLIIGFVSLKVEPKFLLTCLKKIINNKNRVKNECYM